MGVRGLRVRFGRRRQGAYVGKSFDVDLAGAGASASMRTMHERQPRARRRCTRTTTCHDARPRSRRPPTPTATTATTREISACSTRARLDADARALAGDIFARIAEVEAKLHGVRVDRVAFHEVGAYDSIADVVGVAAAIAHLAPASIGSLPPVVGTGRVRTAHGARARARARDRRAADAGADPDAVRRRR